MERESRSAKPFVVGAIIFVTLGISIANETLARFGLEGNYIALFSVAFVVAAVLLGKNLVMLVAIIAGVVAINLPDATLVDLHLDRDILLAVVCAIILLPTVYDLIVN